MRRAARRDLQRASRTSQDEDPEVVVLRLLLRHGYPCSAQGLRELYGTGRRVSYPVWLSSVERHLRSSADATLPTDLARYLQRRTLLALQGPSKACPATMRQRWAERWEKFFFAQLVREVLEEMARRGMTREQAAQLSQLLWGFLAWAHAAAQSSVTSFRPGELPIQYACRMLGTALSAFRAERPEQLPRREHPLRQWMWRRHRVDLPDFRVEPDRTRGGRLPALPPKSLAARVHNTPIARAAEPEQLTLL